MRERVSTQLRQAIRDFPGSSYALAQAARVPRSALSRFASGRGLTVETLDRLAAALGLGLAKIADPPKPKRRRRQPVEPDQAEASVERLGVYWRAGRPYLHLRVAGRAVALEEHSTSPAHLDAGLVYVGLPGLPQLVYHGPTGDVELTGFTADPAAARFYRKFLGYCVDASKWPPESERGLEVMEEKPERPAVDEDQGGGR
jgi:hypothetical protein